MSWRTALWLGVALASGCGPPVNVIGLRQEYPGGRADSLQPTLRWEAFSPAQLGLDPGRVRNVTYELHLWTAAREGAPLGVAYSRDGLTAPQHRVEIPLIPEHRYHWAVRARFELDGQLSITPWSATVPKIPSSPFTDRPVLEPGSPSVYRSFTTPSR